MIDLTNTLSFISEFFFFALYLPISSSTHSLFTVSGISNICILNLLVLLSFSLKMSIILTFSSTWRMTLSSNCFYFSNHIFINSHHVLFSPLFHILCPCSMPKYTFVYLQMLIIDVFISFSSFLLTHYPFSLLYFFPIVCFSLWPSCYRLSSNAWWSMVIESYF